MAKVGRPPKTIKGGISNEERGRIIYLLKTLGDSEESYLKIAEDLGRQVASVKKAVKEIKSIFIEEDETKPECFIKESIVKRVQLNLIKNGFSKPSAQAKINKVITLLSQEEQEKLTESELHSICLRLISAGDLLINKTAGGSDGVSMMTQSASEKLDEKPSAPVVNPNIYKIY